MKDMHSLIDAIDDHLAEDEKQLAQVQQQHDAVHADFASLMTRLRREIEAASGRASGSSAALHLRG